MKKRPKGFEVAREEDGGGLLELMEGESAKGSIELLYTRRPNPVLSYRKESDDVSVGVVRSSDGKPDFMMATVYRDYYMNGVVARAGYIGGVRRRNKSYPRINFFKSTIDFEGHKCNDFYCSILSDNSGAEKTLTRTRANIPCFSPLCGYTTYLMNPKAIKAALPVGYSFAPVEEKALPQLYGFLNKQGKTHNYYPVVRDIPAQFSGVNLADVFVLRLNNEIKGAGFLWDQSHYRQNIVRAYHGGLRLLRWLPKLSTWFGLVPIPQPDTVLKTAMLGLVTVEGNSEALYRAVYAQLAAQGARRGYEIVVAGAPDNSQQALALKSFRSLRFGSHLYTMQVQEDEGMKSGQDASIYLECGWL